MANPERGEVDFEFDKKRYTFKFTNAGKRAMQSFTGLDGVDITQRVNFRRLDETILTGLFWGATRKYHARKFPSAASVDDFMDKLDDAEDSREVLERLVVALVAAYLRMDPEEMRKILFPTEEEAEEQARAAEEDDEDGPDDEASEGEGPKDAPGSPLSGAGTAS